MKIIEMLSVSVILVVIISFLYVEDQTNNSRIEEISERFQDQLTTLYNQSISNITRMTTEFQITLNEKIDEIDSKNAEISNLSSEKATLQSKYDLLNSSVSTQINDRVLKEGRLFYNFTKSFNHALLRVGFAESFLSSAKTDFNLARNTTDQLKANLSKTQYTKSNVNFTSSDLSFSSCLTQTSNTTLLSLVNKYRSMLTYAINMTHEMIQANINISNSTQVIHHWSLYNVSYNQYLNKTAEIETYIRNW